MNVCFWKKKQKNWNSRRSVKSKVPVKKKDVRAKVTEKKTNHFSKKYEDGRMDDRGIYRLQPFCIAMDLFSDAKKSQSVS